MFAVNFYIDLFGILPLHFDDIDHLKVSDEFETSDLDLVGQICH